MKIEELIAFDVLVRVGVASFILTTLIEAIKQKLEFYYDKLPDGMRQLVGYGVVLLAGALVWFTGLDMFPGFGVVVPVVGRVLTCVAGGLGPKLVYDIWYDRPETPIL